MDEVGERHEKQGGGKAQSSGQWGGHRALGRGGHSPQSTPKHVSPSSLQLLLPSGTYLSSNPSWGLPPAPHRTASRCCPPPLPSPGGAGGAGPVPKPGSGGCAERRGHHHPHGPGAGHRAEPGTGPAGLLPLLMVLLKPPALGGATRRRTVPPSAYLPDLWAAVGLEASPQGSALSPIPLALDLHRLSICLSVCRTIQAAGKGQRCPKTCSAPAGGHRPLDVSPKAGATPYFV